MLVPLYAHFLTPAEFGQVDLINTVTGLSASVLILGMDNALFRFYFDGENEEQRAVTSSTTFGFLTAVSSVAAIFMLLLVRPLAAFLQLTPVAVAALPLALIGVVFTVIAPVPNGLMRLEGKSTAFIVISITSLIITGLSNLLLIVWFKLGIMGLVVSQVFGQLLVVTIGVLLFRRSLFSGFSRTLLRQMIQFGWPMMPAGLALWILAMSDRWFLVHYSTLSEVGLYGMAYRVTSVIALAVSTFQLTWPQFAYAVAKRDDAQQIFARVYSLYIAALVGVILGLDLFSREALRLLATPAYAGAFAAVLPLALGYALYGSYYIFSIGAGIEKKTKWIPIITWGSAGLNTLFNYLWIPRWGMVGAGWATALGYGVMAVLMLAYSQWAYFIPYEWGKLAKLGLLSVAILGLGRLTVGLPFAFAIIAKSALGLIYIGMLFLLRFVRREQIASLVSFSKGLVG